MGRAARVTKATTHRVRLEKADYFELRALIRDVEAIELDAMKAAHQFRQQQAVALAARNAKFEAVAKVHGFDPARTYRWDDKTCELIAEQPPLAGVTT